MCLLWDLNVAEKVQIDRGVRHFGGVVLGMSWA